MNNLLLAAAATAEPVNWTLEILKMIVPGVWVGLLGLWIWHLQKSSEPRYDSFKYLAQKQLDSLLKAWSLLAYITDVENSKSVLFWERKDGGDIYYLRQQQARDYITELGKVFYEDGCGLLLGKEIKKLCYEYRNLLYGVLLKAKSQNNKEEMIWLENEKLVETMKMIYSELNETLRKELKKIER